ncbi:OLC1v1036970C1 [Oldenlandia corymbosa var. corymbosa]|uniref:DNA-directed RNA polymerase n=1 Tax=Oldenlandia corymbosa var. corymbosa TaxID=529605 RepID=A0AAV1CYM6_OLDCO|nr:OLC1v1036970C1 [Oldenlandia corymbosa var. corymbosa]
MAGQSQMGSDGICLFLEKEDPYLGVNEIGIPPYFALKLTYPEKVTAWNLAKLRKAIINGPDIHPGALACADKPTLHKPSIMAHVVRVLKGEKALRMHYANCSSYNADFDGDEMNVHFPRDEISRAEAYNIVNANEQYIIPTKGDTVRGLIQDHIVGAVLLTLKDTCLTKDEFNQLLYGSLACSGNISELVSEGIVQPGLPAYWKPLCWTGKQMHGFNCGVEDLIIPPSFDDERKEKLEGEDVGEGPLKLQLEVEKVLSRDREFATALLDMKMKNKLTEKANKISKELLRQGLLKPFPKNCISLMTICGAKGSTVKDITFHPHYFNVQFCKEILKTAAVVIKTPVLTCPFLQFKFKADAQSWVDEAMKITVADIIETMEVHILPLSVHNNEDGDGGDDDNDATADDLGSDSQKRKQQATDEIDYEDASGDESADESEQGVAEDEEIVNVDYEHASEIPNDEKEMSRHKSSDKMASSASKRRNRSKKIFVGKETDRHVFVEVKGGKFEAHFRFTNEPHILLAQIAQRTAKNVYIKSSGKISQCKLVEHDVSENSVIWDKEKVKLKDQIEDESYWALKAAGVDFTAFWEMQDELDVTGV